MKRGNLPGESRAPRLRGTHTKISAMKKSRFTDQSLQISQARYHYRHEARRGIEDDEIAQRRCA